MQNVQTTLRFKVRTRLSTRLVKIHPSLSVEAFLKSFTGEIGFPSTDLMGRPLHYRLRLLSNGMVLPYEKRFEQLEVAYDSVLILDAAELDTQTVLISSPNSAFPRSIYSNRRKRAIKRRSFLMLGIFTAVSGCGLALGATTEVLQRTASVSSFLHPLAPSAKQTVNSITAQKQLIFAKHQGASADGFLLASGSEDTSVLIWDKAGQVRGRLSHPAPVRAAAWAPDNQRLVTGSTNHVTFWQALTGTMLARSTHRHTAPVTSLAWSAQDPFLVVSGAIDKRAIVWPTTGSTAYHARLIFDHHTASIEAASWAPDGRSIATASQGGLIRVWDAMSGQELHGYYQPDSVSMHALSYAPTAASLAAAGDDGLVYIWNNSLTCQQQTQGNFGLQCTAVPQQLRVHTGPVRDVSWSPSGRFLASGGEDGLLAIWAPQQSSSPLLTLHFPDPIQALAWSTTDQQLASASNETVTLWNLHY